MRRSRKAQVNISFKSPENVHFIGKPGLCSDVVINFEEIMSVNLSLVIITMGENDVSNHPRKNWMIQKTPAYPFNNIMIMRKKTSATKYTNDGSRCSQKIKQNNK